MPTEIQVVIDQIKAVLREANTISTVSREISRVRTPRRFADDSDDDRRTHYTEKSDEDIARANTLMLSALTKFSPARLPYVAEAQKIVDHAGLSNDYTREHLIGIVKALLFEYESGSLRGIEELVHADLFTDFLAMARHLLDKNFKDPAAVIAAGVFEQHLKHLALKNNVPVMNGDKYRTNEAINEDLTKANTYQGDTQKEVTAKLAMRKQAAHGEWDKYERAQVLLFIDWVAFFIQRFPA
jgi:hypothetical protein